MSGHQSSSVALLDTRKSGVVISSILHRDQARVYVKQLTDGVPTLELSPEEQEAVDTALAGGGSHHRLACASRSSGPPGTFTEEALRASAPDGAEAGRPTRPSTRP